MHSGSSGLMSYGGLCLFDVGATLLLVSVVRLHRWQKRGLLRRNHPNDACMVHKPVLKVGPINLYLYSHLGFFVTLQLTPVSWPAFPAIFVEYYKGLCY